MSINHKVFSPVPQLLLQQHKLQSLVMYPLEPNQEKIEKKNNYMEKSHIYNKIREISTEDRTDRV